MLLVMLLVGALLLLEPDFGAFAVITAVAMAILFLGGMNWRLFAGLTSCWSRIRGLDLLAVPPAAGDRLMDWSDPYGKGYQLSCAHRLGAASGWAWGSVPVWRNCLPEAIPISCWR